MHAVKFAAALAARRMNVDGVAASARVAGNALQFEVRGLPAAVRGRAAAVFPEIAGVVDNPGHCRARAGRRLARALAVGRATQRESRAACRSCSHSTVAPPCASIATVIDLARWSGRCDARLHSDRHDRRRSRLGFLRRSFALIGGVILNLMPCVFPVLSLKVLALAQHAGTPRERWSSALAYTAGVVLAFLALAGLLIAARAGGEQLGWGFQLQNPAIIAALAALFTLIGLNLAGVFEFGSLLPSGIASLRARDPTLDSFLTGVLAAAVASPCTAPFMGAALGAALTWPAAKSLAVFAALGLGVAAPYLIASAVPAVARRLPRPGRWMETFKVALAFPMFATVIWLTWVLGHQAGVDGAAALLVALLALALAAWWWAHRPEGRGARLVNTAALIVLTVAAFAWAAPYWRPVAPDNRLGANVRRTLATLVAGTGRRTAGGQAARCSWISRPPGVSHASTTSALHSPMRRCWPRSRLTR